jgi:hypothetical protein
MHMVPIIHQNIKTSLLPISTILSVVSGNTLFYEPTRPYINNEATFILSSRVFPFRYLYVLIPDYTISIPFRYLPGVDIQSE